MRLPFYSAEGSKRISLFPFGGLDLREKASADTLQWAKNLSVDAYPALTVRKPREKIFSGEGIQGICGTEYHQAGLTAFTGVMGGHFYYKGEKIDGPALTAGEKSMVDFNGKICIFPDKMYYQYLPDENGIVHQELFSMEKILSATGIRFYSDYDEITGQYTAYLSGTDCGFDRFSPGESIVIEGCSKENNNVCVMEGQRDFAVSSAIVSAVVEKATASRLDLLLYHKDGSLATFSNTTETNAITVKVAIPTMNHVCVHNNRLWGTAENGEYLYASRLGDCMNFYSFQGLSEDSWYSRVGTPGGFTGICSYRSAVVAFKRESIHHIYGDAPQNFAMPKQTMGGCLDGRSIVELSGVLYYLSDRGFCGYMGGEPYGISPQLDDTIYRSAAAGTDGRKYYAAATRRDGGRDLLVYDPLHQIWIREDDTPFLQLLFFAGRLYGATENDVWAFDQGEETFDWVATTQPLTFDSMDQKGPQWLWLRADLEEGASLTVEISYDGEPFSSPVTLTGQGKRTTERIPFRFRLCDHLQLRLSGRGKMILYDLEMMTDQGGRNYGKRKK